MFNRAWCIERSLISAELFLANTSGEIVVVDDGSDDDSVAKVKNYIKKNRCVSIRLVELPMNLGVCAAKNVGARLAYGEWIVFLDSDDELITESANSVCMALKKNPDFPLHFFRCVSEFDKVPHESDRYRLLGLNELILDGTNGEALPVVRADICKRFPYDEDIRGYEGLTYLRIIALGSKALLQSIVARRYYTNHEDRLSSNKGMKHRNSDLFKGHVRVLREFWYELSTAALVKQCLRCVKAFFRIS